MANQESVTTYRIQDLWTASMQRIIATQDRFDSRINQMQRNAGGAFDRIQNRLTQFGGRHTQAMEGITSQIPALGAMGPAMANPYVAGAAAAGMLVVGAQKAAKYAQEWEAKMAEVNVTAQLGKKDLKGLSDELLNIGKRNVAPLEEVPKAFNRILSAGLDVNTSLQALEPTLRAAKAGFTDMETTAAAGVGVMNASGENINRVYDVLFATMDKGNAAFKDIAQYLPKIIPQARAAGFALHETAGAWAYLTAAGNTSERATTLMENAFKSLTSKDRINDFNKMGIAIYDQKGKVLPFISIIEQLKGKLDNISSDKGKAKFMAALNLDTEAKGGFLAMVQNVGMLKESIDTTTNSAGALNNAYKNAAQSGDAWAVISNKFKVVWEKIGEKMLPMIEKAGNWIVGLIDGIEDLNNNSLLFRDTISVIGDAFAWLFKVSTAGIRFLANYWQAVGNVISWVTEKLGLAGDSGESFYLRFRPYLQWIYQMFGKISEVASKVMTGDFSGAWESVKNFKMPNMASIRDQQAKEVEKMASKAKIKDEPQSLNPLKKQTNGLDLTGMGKDKKGGSKEGGVSGGGTKQVTINIQHLVSGVTINAMQVREGMQDLGRIIQEELTKALTDSSLAIANE